MDDENSGNGASANARPLVFPRVFNDFALDCTPSLGASSTYGQGTVTVCTPRNADFASFSKGFEGFRETVCGQGNRLRGTVGASAGKAWISKGFCTFPERRPAPPGACAIYRGQVVRSVCLCTHMRHMADAPRRRGALHRGSPPVAGPALRCTHPPPLRHLIYLIHLRDRQQIPGLGL